MPPKKKEESYPLWYQLFFLYIEPFSTLVGAYFAIFEQAQYLSLTHGPSSPGFVIPIGTSIALTQLGNLYLLFALSEALILRASGDIKVWRALLIGMLIADIGHLYSVAPLAPQVYYDLANYNAIDWGNVVFVYFGASTRIAFLLGVGLDSGKAKSVRRGRKSTTQPASREAIGPGPKTPKTPKTPKPKTPKAVKET